MKYDFITQDSIVYNINRLTNQIWKLIPMRENDEDWEKQLNTILLEVTGIGEIFSGAFGLFELIAKLEGLKISATSFEFYRKTVFECISLIQELKRNDR